MGVVSRGGVDLLAVSRRVNDMKRTGPQAVIKAGEVISIFEQMGWFVALWDGVSEEDQERIMREITEVIAREE